jgi:hypothetical protein
MKQEFMRIGGARTEKEFYEMYPTEQDFIKKHGGAISKLMARGGEAYPQTATMDNFFTYGVPVPPTYYAHGGAFPMAQSEDQFFSPFYGNVPNPYNKAMGGSSEAYPQSMSFPYGNTGRSTHFMMEDGGDMPEEQTLPKMGVNGKLLEFVGTVKNTAANKLNSNLRNYGKVKNPEQYEFEQAKWGGNLKKYQTKDTPGDVSSQNTSGSTPAQDASVVSDKPTGSNVYNYYYGYAPRQNQGAGQLPPEYYNDIDYLYGRRRPLSDFNIRGRGMAGNYRSTGWLEDEYGLDRLRGMGLTEITYGNPKWYQFLKRPTKTYRFGQQGQQPQGYVPGQVNQQGMPVTNQQGPAAGATTGTGTTTGGKDAAGASQPGSTSDLGFFARLFNREGNITPQSANITKKPTDLQAGSPQMVSDANPFAYNIAKSDTWNQIQQNKRKRLFEKKNELEGRKQWQKDSLGLAYDNMKDKPVDPVTGKPFDRDVYMSAGDQLYGRRKRQEDRIDRRIGRSNDRFGIYDEGGSTPPCPPGYTWKGGQCVKQSRKERRENPQQYQSHIGESYRTPVTAAEYKRQEESKAREQELMRQAAEQEKYLRDLPTMNSADEYLKNNPKDTPFVKNKDVTVGTPITEDPYRALPGADPMLTQPVGGAPVMPFVVPSSPSNSKPSFYAPGADMFDGVEYITPDPINFDSTNTQHRAAMMRAILDGATDDTYDDIMRGMKNKKYGGSYNTGDVVDMTPEELQKFIAMGGQVEFLD